MTDLILYSKPFDWNDNLSEEAIEDFETIRGKLIYCQHQSIGMALAKLELLEKQGCKVIDPSGSSSKKPKSEWQQDHEILKAHSDGANKVLDIIKAEIESKYESIPDTFHHYETGFTDALEWVLSIIDKYKEEGSGEE